MTSSPLLHQFEAGDAALFKLLRFLLLLSGTLLLGLIGILPLAWPQQLLIGALTLALVLQGAYDLGNAVGAIAAIVPTFMGVWLGQRARQAVSAETFRRIFLLGMFAVGLHMARGLL